MTQFSTPPQPEDIVWQPITNELPLTGNLLIRAYAQNKGNGFAVVWFEDENEVRQGGYTTSWQDMINDPAPTHYAQLSK